MEEEPFESERPPNEAWWERELHRNEKLMDKYMAVLGDNPDWDKWQQPENPTGQNSFEAERAGADDAASDLDHFPETRKDFPSGQAEECDEWLPAAHEDSDDDAGINADFSAVSGMARRFAAHVFELEEVPRNRDLLFLSAGKIGANLAGGHGLGYEDETICGNVVKCRWALSDCEFCREMIEQLAEHTGNQRYVALLAEAQHLSEAIRERVARLRHRVWW